jgi:hypothetical protein
MRRRVVFPLPGGAEMIVTFLVVARSRRSMSSRRTTVVGLIIG